MNNRRQEMLEGEKTWHELKMSSVIWERRWTNLEVQWGKRLPKAWIIW